MRLQANLDIGAAAPLKRSLLAARGKPLALDAGEVERLGGLCLQVLLAARAMWAADGHDFKVVQPSQAFTEGVRLMAARDLIQEGDIA